MDERGDPPPLPVWDSGGLLVDPADCEELHRVLDADSERAKLNRM